MNKIKDELPLEKIIDIFQNLNNNQAISKDNLIYEINKIYDEYKKIENKKIIFGNENYSSNSEVESSQIDYFLISRMIYFNNKIFKFIPRKIQIISLLYFLNKKINEGLIQQINTGEGKSVIISFLAVYTAIKKNKKIDILTSSPVLAKRDALLFKEFYNSFNLTVDYTSSHNDEIEYNNSFQIFSHECYKCYEADIVYGDTLSFEGDILRSNFMGMKGRGDRRLYECIIIDEIDNIALDNLKNTTELLDSFHGYKFLEYVYLFIYKKLKEIVEEEKKKDKNLLVFDKREDIINDLYEKSKIEFSDLEKLKKEKNIFIPEHLKKYIQDRLYDWCDSAFTAKFIYHENDNYIIKKDNEYNNKVINPLDFYNTGVTQENSVWAGLHQFLQIKEKIMITEENLSSCYMSNLSFFQKYIEKNAEGKIIKNNIYGLTGTIGSEYNIKTLKEIYNLNILIIPPFKESKLIIEKPCIILIKNEENKSIEKKKKEENIDEKWNKLIENKIIKLIKNERSVLVIFQYINEAKRMYNKFCQQKLFEKVILYSRSDIPKESEFLEKQIKPKTLILSTNISGRGTDIKISPELNEKGGLHVILSYEPFNQRIERQAFGRAGRKGENGSAGKIIRSCFSDEEAQKERNNREKEESEFLINVYRKKIEVFEKIFDKFTKLLEFIYDINHNNSLLLDIKERWGLFLIENNLNNIERKYKKDHSSIDSNMFIIIENNYDKFEKDIKGFNFGFDYILPKFGNIITKAKMISNNNNNNYEYLNALYLNKSSNLDEINQAIEKSPNLTLGGYMYKILDAIQNKKNNFENEISSDISILIEKIKLLIKQFQGYKKIISDLGFNKDGYEIINQNNQKIILMESILKLMENNKKLIEEYKSKKDSHNLIIERTNLRKFTEKMKINQLVIEYFREYGLCLFSLKVENNNNDCLII